MMESAVWSKEALQFAGMHAHAVQLEGASMQCLHARMHMLDARCGPRRLAGPMARKQCFGSSIFAAFLPASMALSPEVRARLEGFLAEAADGDRLVKVVESALEYLRQHHLLSSMRLQPMLVGIHPCNRDGYGVNPQDIRDLIDSIIDVGFVKGKVHAVGVEIESPEVREWNERLFATANGLMGSVQPEALKITSICGSHTNAALRLFRDGAVHSNDLVCTGGHLSLERLQSRDKAFYEACMEGLNWDVIAASVAREVPDILPLISRSGNTSLQRGEHELQVLRRIHAMYIRMQAAGETPSFGTLKKGILASKPQCATSVPHMYTFILKASGGTSGSFLKETEQFVRAYCPSSRQLGPQLWDAFGADIKGHPSQPVAGFRHGLLKQAYLRQNVSLSDVKKMTSKEMFPKVDFANTIMTTVRTILTEKAGEAFAKEPSIVQALGAMDMAITSHVLGIKPASDEKRYTTVEAIAHDFLCVARHLSGLDLPLPWAAMSEAAPEPAAGSSQGPEGAILMELKEDGSLKDPAEVLKSKGYKVGCHLRRRIDKIEGEIVLVGKHAEVALSDGKTAKVSLDSLLAGEWAVFEPRADAEIIEDLSLYTKPPS